jgi:hypothetical protein
MGFLLVRNKYIVLYYIMSKSRKDVRRKPFNSTGRFYRLSRSLSRSISNVNTPLRTLSRQLRDRIKKVAKSYRESRDKTKGSKSNTKTRKKIEEIEEKPKIKSYMKPVKIVGDSDSVEDGIIRNPSREKKITKRMEPTENTQEKSQDEDDILKTGFDFGNKRKTRKSKSRSKHI